MVACTERPERLFWLKTGKSGHFSRTAGTFRLNALESVQVVK